MPRPYPPEFRERAVALVRAGKPISRVAAELGMSSLASLAMGVQAYVARKLAVRDVTTVVVTSTLTALAGEFFVRPTRKGLLNRRTAAIMAILLGAAAGAFVVKVSLGLALIGSGAIILVVSLLGHWADRVRRSA